MVRDSELIAPFELHGFSTKCLIWEYVVAIDGEPIYFSDALPSTVVFYGCENLHTKLYMR